MHGIEIVLKKSVRIVMNKKKEGDERMRVIDIVIIILITVIVAIVMERMLN